MGFCSFGKKSILHLIIYNQIESLGFDSLPIISTKPASPDAFNVCVGSEFELSLPSR